MVFLLQMEAHCNLIAVLVVDTLVHPAVQGQDNAHKDQMVPCDVCQSPLPADWQKTQIFAVEEQCRKHCLALVQGFFALQGSASWN